MENEDNFRLSCKFCNSNCFICTICNCYSNYTHMDNKNFIKKSKVCSKHDGLITIPKVGHINIIKDSSEYFIF